MDSGKVLITIFFLATGALGYLFEMNCRETDEHDRFKGAEELMMTFYTLSIGLLVFLYLAYEINP